jgi:hypothetical protein
MIVIKQTDRDQSRNGAEKKCSVPVPPDPSASVPTASAAPIDREPSGDESINPNHRLILPTGQLGSSSTGLIFDPKPSTVPCSITTVGSDKFKTASPASFPIFEHFHQSSGTRSSANREIPPGKMGNCLTSPFGKLSSQTFDLSGFANLLFFFVLLGA